MRIVVAVQAKSSSSRGLVHYIAHSKIDPAKEPKTRELFNEYSDQTTVEKSNAFLKRGTSAKRPSNDELHHLVISLKSADYDRLGTDADERQQSLKQITRHALKTLADSIGAEKLSWAAGIHLNTANPHVHIAIQKEYFDKNLEKKTLRKIPASLLPHYEKTSGEKRFVPGLLIEAANEKLEEILLEKKRAQQQKSLTRKTHDDSARAVRENDHENNGKLPPEDSKQEAAVKQERDILARAIIAKHHLEKTRENLRSLEDHGDKRRFKIYDEITANKRIISLFDLERRAEKTAARRIKDLGTTDPLKKEALRKDLVDAELQKNAAGIKRIKTILHNLVKRENQSLRKREDDYGKLKPFADKIRQKHRSESTKLPVPNLTFAQIELLQTHSLAKNDIRAANYLERVRMELAAERGIPPRTIEETARLKAKQTVSQLKTLAFEKRLKNFSDRKRAFPVELKNGKWTLLKVDSFIEKKQKDDQKLIGRLGRILGKAGLVTQVFDRANLEEIRAGITEALVEKNEQLTKELKTEKSIQKTLDQFLKNDPNTVQEIIEPQFTAAELAEIESLAFELGNGEVYRENWHHQKSFIKRFPGRPGTPAESVAGLKQKTIAGRAIAREILCDIELARAREELKLFRKIKNFQKFEIFNEKTGETKFVSLRDVQFDSRGSLFDQTLEYFTENREKRFLRNKLEKIVKQKEVELKENLKTTKIFYRTSVEETRDHKSKSFFGAVNYSQVPLFTPKELITVELRIKQTDNKSEAARLQKLLDSTDHSEAKNLSTILADFSAGIEQETTERSAVKEPKINEIEATQSIQVTTVESRNQDRGR